MSRQERRQLLKVFRSILEIAEENDMELYVHVEDNSEPMHIIALRYRTDSEKHAGSVFISDFYNAFDF